MMTTNANVSLGSRLVNQLHRVNLNWWGLFFFIVAGLVSLPLMVVSGYILTPAGEVWQHITSTVLAEYIRNSLWLIIGVGTGTLVIGVLTAWLCSMCHFPGRGIFEWALLLPMAMPAYIIAYTYTGMFEFAGPFRLS